MLKRALEPYLPRDLLYRPKQGFAPSLAGLFRREAGRVRTRLMSETLLDSGLFVPATIERLLREHEAGRFDHSQTLWLLLVFEGFLAAASGEPGLALEAAVRRP